MLRTHSLCVCVCVCVCACVPACMRACVCVYASVSAPVFVFSSMRFYLCLSPSPSLSHCLSVSVSVCTGSVWYVSDAAEEDASSSALLCPLLKRGEGATLRGLTIHSLVKRGNLTPKPYTLYPLVKQGLHLLPPHIPCSSPAALPPASPPISQKYTAVVL